MRDMCANGGNGSYQSGSIPLPSANQKPTNMKKVRTYADIKKDPRVSDIYRDGDGYWIHLKRGWICEGMDCGTIHEDTIALCAERMNLDVKYMPEVIEREEKRLAAIYG